MDIVYLRLLLRRLQCLFDPTRTWTLCNPLKRNQKAEMSLDRSFPKYKRTRIDCNIKKEYEQSTFCDPKDKVVPYQNCALSSKTAIHVPFYGQNGKSECLE